MAARPIWKGQLRLSLVSIPVELYTATKTGARISFRQIHEPSGKPIRYEKVVPGIGPVSSDEIVKGYAQDGDRYLLLDPDEIEAIKLETKKTFELVQFVGACEILPLYFDKPYYLVPADDLAEDAYRVVRDALAQAEKIGLGQITMRGREHLAAVRPCGDGLLMETLHYADEIRKADPMFSAIAGKKADRELLDIATALIDKKTAPFDAAAFTDNYTAALHQLIARKTKAKSTRKVTTQKEKRDTGGDDGNVIDLMATLKQSLEKSKPARKAPQRKGASQRKKSA